MCSIQSTKLTLELIGVGQYRAIILHISCTELQLLKGDQYLLDDSDKKDILLYSLGFLVEILPLTTFQAKNLILGIELSFQVEFSNFALG